MILLLRHGQTDWNLEPTRCQGWADVPLNETGRAQARDLGRALRGRGLDLMVTSHLARARETATIVRTELATGSSPATPIVDPRLAESDRGCWEGRPFAEIAAAEPETWRRYREHPQAFRFPGGETLVEQQRRVLACLRDVALDGRRALLVTHGGSIRLVRCFIAGGGIAAFHEGDAQNGMLLEVAGDGLAERIERYLLGNAQAVEARTR